MKKLFGCLLLLGCSTVLLAQQKISFSVYGGPLYAQPSVDTVYSESNSITMVDSTGFWSRPGTSVIAINAIGTVGFDLGGTIHIPIANKIKLRTGIGIRNQAFKLGSEFLGITPDLSADLVFTPFLSSNGVIFESTCDESIDNIDKTFAVPTRQYDMLHLNIPLGLEMTLFDLFYIDAGINLSTPIWTNFWSNQITTHFDTSILDDGTEWTICTSESIEINDHTGNNFRNLVLGAQLGLAYQISDKFSLGLNFSGSFNSLFVPNPNQTFVSTNRLHTSNVKVLNRTVGFEVRYLIAPKKEE